MHQGHIGQTETHLSHQVNYSLQVLAPCLVKTIWHLKNLLAYKKHKTAIDHQAISLFNNANNGIVVGLYSKAVIKYTSLLRAHSAYNLNRLLGIKLNYRLKCSSTKCKTENNTHDNNENINANGHKDSNIGKFLCSQTHLLCASMISSSVQITRLEKIWSESGLYLLLCLLYLFSMYYIMVSSMCDTGFNIAIAANNRMTD